MLFGNGLWPVIGSSILTLAVTALAVLPGLLLIRGRAVYPGQRAAAMTASLGAMLLATALIGASAGLLGLSLPSFVLVPVSLIGCALALWKRWETPLRAVWREPTEWQGLVVAAILVVVGLASMAAAIRIDTDGALLIHGWYNADWFKHMGHVHALANFGIPARDIFGNAGSLHYYWLTYLLPGAAASLGAEPWTAMSAVNAVIAALLGCLLYGLTRIVVHSRTLALTATLLAFVVCAPAGFFFYFVGGQTLEAFFDSGLAPSGSGLLATAQVIPQHAFAMALLLAWMLLTQPGGTTGRVIERMALFALAAELVISTLLGALLLAAYGLLKLTRERLRALPEAATMAVLSLVLMIALGVLQFGHYDSAIESPLLTNPPDPRPKHVLAVAGLLKAVALVGFPFLVAVFVILRWKPEDDRLAFAKQAALTMIAAALAGVIATQVALPERLASETFIRAPIPLSAGTMILGAWALQAAWKAGPRARWIAVGTALALLVVALPSIYARSVWLSNFGDGYTTVVPDQDRQTLAELRRASGPRDRVWQFPEKPAVGRPSGRDSWSAIFAGRAVPNSERATDYSAALPYIRLSEQWFSGEVVPIPGDMGWVYLSRALHPQSYDRLVDRMQRDPAWSVRVCYPDACIFSRSDSTRP